jgi:uroporphyrinogen-III decarboxylase
VQRVISAVKAKHPKVPIILYIRSLQYKLVVLCIKLTVCCYSKSAALIEKMAISGADVISLDWTVSNSICFRTMCLRLCIRSQSSRR